MQRLASEKGFLMYEIGDVIYFGQPTWLVKRSKTVEVVWEGNDSQAPMTFPEFRQSLDNEDVELTIELPIERAGTIYPGQGLQLSGYSKFSGTYFIQSVKYPLVGVGNVAVTASTVRNPEPQKSGDAGGTSSSDGKVKSREFNHPGSTQEAAKKYTKWDGKGKPKYGELVKVGGVWLPYGIDKAGKNVKFDFDKMNLKYSDDLEGFGNMFD
jgi:hypothetical protein